MLRTISEVLRAPKEWNCRIGLPLSLPKLIELFALSASCSSPELISLNRLILEQLANHCSSIFSVDFEEKQTTFHIKSQNPAYYAAFGTLFSGCERLPPHVLVVFAGTPIFPVTPAILEVSLQNASNAEQAKNERLLGLYDCLIRSQLRSLCLAPWDKWTLLSTRIEKLLAHQTNLMSAIQSLNLPSCSILISERHELIKIRGKRLTVFSNLNTTS